MYSAPKAGVFLTETKEVDYCQSGTQGHQEPFAKGNKWLFLRLLHLIGRNHIGTECMAPGQKNINSKVVAS